MSNSSDCLAAVAWWVESWVVFFDFAACIAAAACFGSVACMVRVQVAAVGYLVGERLEWFAGLVGS